MNNKFNRMLLKKQLDFYSNRRKERKMKTLDELVVRMTESTTLYQSTQTGENIRDIGEAVKAAREKGFPILRTPIIAGGAIRDYVYGLKPEDYDIFIDVSKIAEEDQEDAVLLFGMRVIDELVKNHGTKFLSLEDTTLRKLGDEAPYGTDDNPNRHIDPRWKKFYVFETGDFNERASRMRAEAIRERFGEQILLPENGTSEIDRNFQFPKIQFIGHNDDRLSQNDPLPFVEYFDYELVRCLYDPEVREFKLHEDFIRAATEKVLKSDDDRVRARIQSFLRRFPWRNDTATGNYVPTGTIKLERVTPKKKIDKKTFKWRTKGLDRGELYPRNVDLDAMNALFNIPRRDVEEI